MDMQWIGVELIDVTDKRRPVLRVVCSEVERMNDETFMLANIRWITSAAAQFSSEGNDLAHERSREWRETCLAFEMSDLVLSTKCWQVNKVTPVESCPADITDESTWPEGA